MFNKRVREHYKTALGYFEWEELQGFGRCLPDGAFLCEEHRDMVTEHPHVRKLHWAFPCGYSRECGFCSQDIAPLTEEGGN